MINNNHRHRAMVINKELRMNFWLGSNLQNIIFVHGIYWRSARKTVRDWFFSFVDIILHLTLSNTDATAWCNYKYEYEHKKMIRINLKGKRKMMNKSTATASKMMNLNVRALFSTQENARTRVFRYLGCRKPKKKS